MLKAVIYFLLFVTVGGAMAQQLNTSPGQKDHQMIMEERCVSQCWANTVRAVIMADMSVHSLIREDVKCSVVK